MSDQPIEVNADEVVVNTEADGGGIDHNETVETPEPDSSDTAADDAPGQDADTDAGSSDTESAPADA